jgi:hypothetical protein
MVDPDDDLIQDIEHARQNLKALCLQAEESLQGLVDLADQSQHPRSYEVLAGFLKTAGELNKDYVAVATGKASVRARRNQGQPSPQQNITNQNLFVGTTKELADLLKGMNKKDPDGSA